MRPNAWSCSPARVLVWASGLHQPLRAYGAAGRVHPRRRVDRLEQCDPVIDEDLRTGIENAEYQVAVEADQVDLTAREGWTVLVIGAAHHLDTEAERAPFIDAGPEPWYEDIPTHFIRVIPTHIWGGRARHP